jgi:hypothetical protein
MMRPVRQALSVGHSPETGRIALEGAARDLARAIT